MRPLKLLALHHNRIEAWVLEQAGIEFDAKAMPSKLRVVVLQIAKRNATRYN